jgi:hypothetical protein
MISIVDFDSDFERLLPEAYAIIRRSNLVVHNAVEQIFLSGSRGLAGGYRPDSDVDLSLMVDIQQLPARDPERENLLRNVLDTSLSRWKGPVEIDLAAVFDRGDCCGLRCFQTRDYDAEIIGDRGTDCFGIFKVQRGFNGYVIHGVQLARMYPLLRIWHR